MPVVRLDNRGLPPPEPMVRILAAIERAASEDIIEALLDRRPMFLFPELEERGLRFTCDENPDGGFVLRVWRGGA